MKVAVVSKSDVRGGGASAVAADVTRYLQKFGHTAVHFNADDDSQHPIYGGAGPVIRALKNLEGKRGYRDHNPFELLSSTVRSLRQDFDIVHMHDLSTTLSHEAVNWISQKTPVLWTLHDCSPFTAGCLYPTNCTQFQSTCEFCPQLGNWPMQTRKNRVKTLHTRRKKLQQENVHFSAPSRWMIEQYKSAGWPADKAHFITNGVDLEGFRLRNVSEMRKKHDIPDDGRPVYLFSASHLGDSRKGPNKVAEIARIMEDKDPVIVLVGRYSELAADLFEGLSVVHAGFVKDQETRAELYSLCDTAFVFSEEENCPLIVLECLASGTPIAGFANGGIPELVDNGVTGILTKNKIEPIVEFLRELTPEKLTDIRKSCREAATSGHNYEDICNSYIKLYQQILGGTVSGASQPATAGA
ncbi:glycosyltransferase [Ruegeria atlantica]|uniref:glycosyltransferase n=1 Tax=Ruegeria atlantica TaxID=81569 RepID=UPI00147CF2B7|nr:glycosyltransferase [Ruegeria atlantica]